MTVAAFLVLAGLAKASRDVLVKENSTVAPILNVSESAWSALNSSVSGRLHAGQPQALPCYETYQSSFTTSPNTMNLARCQAIQQGLKQSETLVAEFDSYHSPSFSTCMARGEKCVLSATSSVDTPIEGTCFQGSIPDYYIDVREIQDIQSVLAFANEYDIPITIKNTGHDYKGRSTSPNSLAIWTHNIQPDIVLDEDFTPESCPESVGPVVTYGAGQMFNGIYEFLDGTGYMMVSGSCPTVGASGGWIAGGGHGVLAPNYGLGVDNAMQMKVVLPNGTFVTANRCQNQDIFFALRGGGGGTFGVVTETTSKLHQDTAFTFASLSMAVPTGPKDITEIFVRNAVKWAEEGWGGYLGVGVNNATLFLGIPPHLTVEEAEASLKPVVDYFASVSGGSIAYRANITTLPSHYSFEYTPESQAFVKNGLALNVAQASRLTPQRNFEGEDNVQQLVDVLIQQPYGSLVVPPYKFELPESDLPGGSGESALTPAWRHSIWHLVYQTFWDPADPAATTPEALAGSFRQVTKAMDQVRTITPDGGAYMNEGDTYEPDPAGSYWGEVNYQRLLKIKRELDPKNLLSCFKCVGWEESDPRHQCYPKL